MLIAQFNVPVREIDEVLPEIMLRRGKSDVDEGTPFWPLRLADQAHVRFTRQPVAFARVAGNARANHVLPCSRPSAIARHDVIEIELAAVKNLAAVLAGVPGALQHAPAGKFHLPPSNPVSYQKANHPPVTNLARTRTHSIRTPNACRH